MGYYLQCIDEDCINEPTHVTTASYYKNSQRTKWSSDMFFHCVAHEQEAVNTAGMLANVFSIETHEAPDWFVEAQERERSALVQRFAEWARNGGQSHVQRRR